eukprot:gene9133-10081_t
MSEATESQRRINRTLTQKYDINALRALQKLEEVVLEQVEAIYEVPSEFDIIAIYNRKDDEREAKLREALAQAPQDVSGIIATILEEYKRIDEMSSN